MARDGSRSGRNSAGERGGGRFGIEALESRRLMATLVVNSTADTDVPGPVLALRRAIEVSNGTLAVSALSPQERAQITGAPVSASTVDFKIPGAGVRTATGTRIGVSPGGPSGVGGNVIANNTHDGVSVQGADGSYPAAVGTEILGHSISGNPNLGIDIQPGADHGVAAPVLANPVFLDGATVIPTTIEAHPGDSYRIEFFAPNRSGPGQSIVGEFDQPFDPIGPGVLPSFPITLLPEIPGDLTGRVLTATVTDLGAHDTSAVSNNVPAAGSLAASSLRLSVSGPVQSVANTVLYTFSAAVAPLSGGGTPTGLVVFTLDGVPQPPRVLGVVNGVDVATFEPNPLAPGAHTVTAAYAGDSGFAPVGAQSIFVKLDPAGNLIHTPLGIAVSARSNPVDPNFVSLFTFLTEPPGSAAPPNDPVTITVDGRPVVQMPISPGGQGSRVNGVLLPPGRHVVSATYAGDSYYGPATAPPVTITVPRAPTRTTIRVGGPRSAFGQPVTLSAAVALPGVVPPPGYPPFLGVVTFREGSKVLASVPVRPDGSAAFTTAALGVGGHAITATYGNDPFYAASPSAAARETVSPPPDGPKLVSVRRFGYHRMPTTLVLSFNAALDPPSARDPNNYRLTDPSGRAVPIGPAAYDLASETVTIRPRHPLDLHRRYVLTVVGTGPGGVRGTSGSLLDGANTGRAGSNFVTTVDAANLVVTNPLDPDAAAALGLSARVRSADAF